MVFKNLHPVSKLTQGVSLVELLVAMGIFSIVSVLLGSIYFANFRLFATQDKLIEIANQNRIAIDEIANQIRQSKTVSLACCSETTGSNVLILQLLPLDASGNPTEPAGGGGYDYVIYKRDPANTSNLTKRVVPDTVLPSTRQAKTTILATTVSNLAFTYTPSTPDLTAATQITIDLATTATTTFGKTQTHSQKVNAVLRNK